MFSVSAPNTTTKSPAATTRIAGRTERLRFRHTQVSEAVQNPADADPVIALSRWEKVEKPLPGASGFTEPIGKISENVAELFA